jgi:hypothetical protein
MQFPFPLWVFPAALRIVLLFLAGVLNIPPSYLAASFLSAVSTATGNAVRIRHLDIDGNISIINVGPTGANKSKPIEIAYAPLIALDTALHRLYNWQVIRYYLLLKTLAPDTPRPKFPRLIRLILSDTTLPALFSYLTNYPRGIAVYLDEVSGLFSNLGRNAQQLMTLFSGLFASADRKGGSIRIEKPFVNLIGTIQTVLLAPFLGRRYWMSNGLLERLLFVVEESTKLVYKPFADTGYQKQYWDSLLRKIIKGLRGRTTYLTFSSEAGTAVLDYLNQVNRQHLTPSALDDETRQRIDVKMNMNVYKFCILLSVLRWAVGESPLGTIDLRTAQHAITLTEYFRGQSYAVWEILNQNNPLDQLTPDRVALYDALPPEPFTTRDGLEFASQYNMSPRSFKYWLQDTRYFKRISHGLYQKVYLVK